MGRLLLDCQLPFVIDDIRFLEISYRRRTERFRESSLTYNSLIYVTNGEMRYSLGDAPEDQWVVPCGSAVFFPEGALHTTFYPEEGATVELVQFKVIRGSLPESISRPMVFGECGLEKELVELRRIREEGVDGGYMPNNTRVRVSQDSIRLLYKVYGILNRIAKAGEVIPALYRRILPAVREIEKNYAEECRTQDLAELCCMSESGFRRLFRLYLGMSPVEYRNTLRLREAKQLIESGFYGIADAAANVGFSNLSFFYRLYKRAFGCSPGETLNG